MIKRLATPFVASRTWGGAILGLTAGAGAAALLLTVAAVGAVTYLTATAALGALGKAARK